MTSSPWSRACWTIDSRASQPGKPSRSKHASCGLTATQAGPAASISARQWPSMAAAVSSRVWRPPSPRSSAADRSTSCSAMTSRARDSTSAATASGHSFAGAGSIPRTIWDSRAATAEARRSPNGVAGDASPATDKSVARPTLLDGLLQARSGREAGDAARGDLHRLAGPRIPPLARAALGDVELPEARERDLFTVLQRVLDRLDDRVDRRAGVLLGQTARTGDLVDELVLRHRSSFVPWGVVVAAKLTRGPDAVLALCRRSPVFPAICELFDPSRVAAITSANGAGRPKSARRRPPRGPNLPRGRWTPRPPAAWLQRAPRGPRGGPAGRCPGGRNGRTPRPRRGPPSGR